LSEDLIWRIGTALVAISGAWVAMRERVKHLDKRVAAVETEQDSARSLALQLAVATTTITHLSDRLERIEHKLDRAMRVSS
jgi:hypothetical protein